MILNHPNTKEFHNKGSEAGQMMVLLLVVLPLLIVLCGVIVRSGRVVLLHQQIQNHCDKKILDALAVQGEALHKLGKLNSEARQNIKILRIVEKGEKYVPLWIVKLGAKAGKFYLKGRQLAISLEQKAIITASSLKTSSLLSTPYSLAKENKVTESFTPNSAIALHSMKSAITLHVKPEQGYEEETGAPLVPDDDFDRRQRIHGDIQVKTESFLSPWPGFKPADKMTVSCEAKIEMKSLEDKWTAVLVPETDKHSLKPHWLSSSLF